MWYTKYRPHWHTLRNPPETSLTPTKACDVAGCPARGDYRAPKSRDSLKDYYWFCLEHVREYNQRWDFFKGMSQMEIETAVSRTAIWDLPTWRATQAGFNEEKLRKSVYERFAGGESVFETFRTGAEEEEESVRIDVSAIPHPAVEALAVMDLVPPIGWEEVKTRYKALAKQYHPDVNPGSKTAEERLKKINLAYSILKLSYQNFTKLDQT